MGNKKYVFLHEKCRFYAKKLWNDLDRTFFSSNFAIKKRKKANFVYPITKVILVVSKKCCEVLDTKTKGL